MPWMSPTKLVLSKDCVWDPLLDLFNFIQIHRVSQLFQDYISFVILQTSLQVVIFVSLLVHVSVFFGLTDISTK